MAAILTKIYFEKCEKSPIFKDFLSGKALTSIQLPLGATLLSRATFLIQENPQSENRISWGRQKHNKNISLLKKSVCWVKTKLNRAGDQ